MDFIDEPRNELMGIMVLVVVEKGISCPDSCDKPSVVYDTPLTFGVINIFEKFIQLIDQVILLRIAGFPIQDLFAKRNTVIKDLNGGISVANIWILKNNINTW